MPVVQLSDRLLNSNGILERLKEMQSDVAKIPLERREAICRKKIESIREDLSSIFRKSLLNSSHFRPDYLLLEQTIHTVFSNQSLNEMVNAIESLTQQDWQPKLEVLEKQYQRLNNENRYFELESTRDTLMALFKQLVISCRKVCVLIEKNNTEEDTMAYEYAYKLMALFVDENEKIPTFEALSRNIQTLLEPQDRLLNPLEKPFHDNLLVFKLPDKEYDKNGWLSLLKRSGIKVLPLFSQAIAIEKILHKAPENLKQAQEIASLLTYNRAEENPEWAMLCSKYRVSQNTFNAGLEYFGTPIVWPKKFGDNIPDITITSDKYIWTKLAAHDYHGLILGDITECCQSIDGHSAQCVKDATSLNDNGLYVLLRQKGSSILFKKPDGSINDEDYDIIGQSYVWKSKSGNLCLDSIECLLDTVTPEELREILVFFAREVLNTQPSIKRVTIGMGGKTPEKLFPETNIPEIIAQGLFYGDATTQYVIQEIPCRLTAEQQQVLRQSYPRSFCDRMLYLSNYIKNTTDFIENLRALLIDTPSFQYIFTVEALHELLHFAPEPTFEDLKGVNFDNLQSPDTTLTTLWPTGRLIWQANTPDRAIKALQHIRTEDRLKVLKEKKYSGKTVLYAAASNPESLKSILSVLPESEQLAQVKENSALHAAASHPQSLEMVLALYPESQRLAAMKEKDSSGMTVLHAAASNPRSLEMVLALYPESQRLAAIKEKDSSGMTVLHAAASNSRSLEMVLALYPESQRLAAIKEEDIFHRSVLYAAANNPQSLEMVLALYPESQRFTAVNKQYQYGQTVLGIAKKNTESFKNIFKLLPQSNRLAAIKIWYNALDVCDFGFLQTILGLLSESDRLTALKEKDRHGYTILHAAARKPESITTILTLLQDSDRLGALDEEDPYGRNVLHVAAMYPNSLVTILSLLPESHRLSALKKRDIKSNTILHMNALDSESLKSILTLLPESERLSVLSEENSSGNTTLNIAMDNYQSIEIIFTLLPEAARLAVVKEKEPRLGNTLLHRAATKPDSLKAILERLSEPDRLNALKETNTAGNTVLHTAVKMRRPESIEVILNLLPESSHLAVLTERNKDGHTVLDVASKKTGCLEYILESLSIDNLARLAHENEINFDILKASLIDKARELKYPKKQIQSICNANTPEVLQQTLNTISQAEFKNRIRRGLDDTENENRSDFSKGG